MRYRPGWQGRVRVDPTSGVVRVDGREAGIVRRRPLPGEVDRYCRKKVVFEVDGLIAFETLDQAVDHIFQFTTRGARTG